MDDSGHGLGAPDPAALDLLAALIADRPFAVLTGAGVSTDSGIPDYRGRGAPQRTPLRADRFFSEEDVRRRFWAGARLGANIVGLAKPNSAHLVLAELERAGQLSGVVTQNVDGLHSEAGSQNVLELHGNGSVIRCVLGGHRFARAEVLRWVDRVNPELLAAAQTGLALHNPDADAEVAGLVSLDSVTVPICPICGGMLRPDVVFFGEYVPRETFEAASEIVASGGALLVVGSSLAVNTGIRLLNLAEREGAPIAIINRGPTKGDARARVRLECGAAEGLTALAARLLPNSGLLNG
jgi:NAD-dependent SIR2 family protein deacetylase